MFCTDQLQKVIWAGESKCGAKEGVLREFQKIATD